MSRRSTIVISAVVLTGLTAATVITASSLIPSAEAQTAATAATAAAPTPVFQEWIYPGPVGSATCSAPSEYADGRVQNGALKAEYYTINANGDAVRLNASSA